jgi:putative SOS response-associated peptidase YedK
LVDQELKRMVIEMEKNAWETYTPTKIKTNGEIFPTDVVPVQTVMGSCQPMQWGFSRSKGRPVINARSESALEKPMFLQAMRERRCLIPAGGYYEWLSEGNKKTRYRFFDPGRPLYLAGCWRREKDGGRCAFVILTRPAVKAVAAIHHRMPVSIPHQFREAWLCRGPEIMQEALTELSVFEVRS